MKGTLNLNKLAAYSNTDWMVLPILIIGSYPDAVMDKARKIASTQEEEHEVAKSIAKTLGVSDSRFVMRAFPYDKMDTLLFIQEDPENSSYSNIIFDSGDSYIINIPFKQATRLIHKFMLQEPVYRKPLPPEMFVPVEITEIGHSSEDTI